MVSVRVVRLIHKGVDEVPDLMLLVLVFVFCLFVCFLFLYVFFSTDLTLTHDHPKATKSYKGSEENALLKSDYIIEGESHIWARNRCVACHWWTMYCGVKPDNSAQL